jgi:hypothetical protein
MMDTQKLAERIASLKQQREQFIAEEQTAVRLG